MRLFLLLLATSIAHAEDVPTMPFAACAVGQSIDLEAQGFVRMKPTAAVKNPVVFAGQQGAATVQTDAKGNVATCTFQSHGRDEASASAAFAAFAGQHKKMGWKVIGRTPLPDHVSGEMVQIEKAGTCRQVYWGCELQADVCSATVSQLACREPALVGTR